MEEELEFGPFRVIPSQRRLLRDRKVVPLGSRAIDILIHLIAHAGEVRTNREIVKHVWPDTVVDEANIRVHISGIRRALNDTQRPPRFIANIPGRGYAFIAPVTKRPAPPGENSAPAPCLPMTDLGTGRIFGRESLVETISAHLGHSRLLTIVGPGGIGKTTVARAVIARDRSEGLVLWVDLSSVSGGHLVPTVVASALGILSRTDNILREIAAHLRTRSALVVLDSCEHLVGSVAEFAECLLAETPGLRILATSREPLRASGERVHRIPPLELPIATLTASAAMRSPAVQLFVERADGCLGQYELTDEDAPYVGGICEKLDGIALAIELAAGRLETIGVKALAQSLSDCFRVLTLGRRTALPRHQTLRATLDWSYMILPKAEQSALGELSVFRGHFSEEAAAAVVSGGNAEAVLASLVAKSLVVADASSGPTQYRLLDTTRLYASEKLMETGATSAVMASLAEHLRIIFEDAEHELVSASAADWTRNYAQHTDDLRAALEWAFAEGRDPLLGVRLIIAALPFFYRLSLLDECLAWVPRAITDLDAHPGLDERSRMKLYAALGWPQICRTGAPAHGIAAWSQALRIAEGIGDTDYQLRAIWALWVDAVNRAEPCLGLTFAERFRALASSSPDPADPVIGKRLFGATLHWLGRHAEARDHLQQMLAEYAALPASRHSVRFQFDQNVTARIVLARSNWLLGNEEQALCEVEDALAHAKEIQHNLSFSNALAEAACPLALLASRDDLAIHYTALLKEHTKALSLDVWNRYADCFEAEIALRKGRPDKCARQLGMILPTLRDSGFTLFQTIFQSVAARALRDMGKHVDALRVIDSAIADCASSGERWCLAELHRVKGTILLVDGLPNARERAGDSYRRALAEARRDGAIAWERRVNASLHALSPPCRMPEGDQVRIVPSAGGGRLPEPSIPERRELSAMNNRSQAHCPAAGLPTEFPSRLRQQGRQALAR
ncbi:winged helix-turn-helix domain-containing protein [Azospirillum sp. YIM DDC1]|uniref:Winged helix-turn-helix domain-containing protein n=1 Tax=Azospirillum aestuarii TaxID=2802052 RepID=A0ABS1I8K3_9PROT|nr:winged helix-turn-helix domain-containing protein [Azospirillum aestuarii]MBK4723397.1 winged helix-turn-helix domain-containing protein [Azospirillum aestuarii]